VPDTVRCQSVGSNFFIRMLPIGLNESIGKTRKELVQVPDHRLVTQGRCLGPIRLTLGLWQVLAPVQSGGPIATRAQNTVFFPAVEQANNDSWRPGGPFPQIAHGRTARKVGRSGQGFMKVNRVYKKESQRPDCFNQATWTNKNAHFVGSKEKVREALYIRRVREIFLRGERKELARDSCG